MKWTCIAVLSMVCLTALGASAQAQTVEVRFTGRDEFVDRSMKIVTKTGEPITGIQKIRSFDPATAALIFEDVAGSEKRLPVSNLERIEFVQNLNRSNPVAQAAAWKVTSKPGRIVSYAIPQTAFQVRSDKLELSADWKAPQTRNPEPAPPQESDSGFQISRTAEIVEPKILTYDTAKKSFTLEVQFYTYARKVQAGSSSGPGKPVR
jgi:hypothetical protein